MPNLAELSSILSHGLTAKQAAEVVGTWGQVRLPGGMQRTCMTPS